MKQAIKAVDVTLDLLHDENMESVHVGKKKMSSKHSLTMSTNERLFGLE